MKREPVYLAAKFTALEQARPLVGCRLLEVGPGQGLFLWWARQRGCEVLGVEPSPDFCQVLAETGLPHLRGTLAELHPTTHGTFNVIYMAHVLEHFYDPNEALRQCRALLSDGGILAVEVPNILKPFRSLDRYFLRYVHPSSFSPQTLQALLTKHCFRSFHKDEGGNDWREPQHLFVIAEKQKDGPDQPLSVPAETDQVLKALQNYRRRWRGCLSLKWHARSLALGLRRRVIKAGRLVKRMLLGGRGKVIAQN
ncbi:MAG: class I SAM-dependent methyltransferase [Verrucomicrobia bacterium]|nr:class I SAM-dependent methyltransferase [Verrucomicrobiota bacterium]